MLGAREVGDQATPVPNPRLFQTFPTTTLSTRVDDLKGVGHAFRSHPTEAEVTDGRTVRSETLSRFPVLSSVRV